MYPRLALAIVMLVGCTASYRTSSGGALAKPGVAGGTTGSIYLGDRGGLFTKLGITMLGAAAIAGTARNVQTTSTKSGVYDRRTGDRVGTEITTTTTGTIDADAAREVGRSMEAVNAEADRNRRAALDPTQNYSTLSGGLEIASPELGGDTSGWMFDFGWRGAKRYGAWGFKSSIKFGFGKFTYADRMVQRGLATFQTIEDSTYTFIGLPMRLAITYRGVVDVFAQLDFNVVTAFNELLGEQASSPSPWRSGVRLTVAKYLYIEGAIAISSMRDVNRSTILEAGVEF